MKNKKFIYFIFLFSVIISISLILACVNPGSCSVEGHSQCGDVYNLSGSNHSGELCIQSTACDGSGWPYCTVSCTACPDNYTCVESSYTLASCQYVDPLSVCSQYDANELSGFSQSNYSVTLDDQESYTFDLDTPMICGYSYAYYIIEDYEDNMTAGWNCYLENMTCPPPTTFDHLRLNFYSNGQSIFLQVTNDKMIDSKTFKLCGSNSSTYTCVPITVFPLNPDDLSCSNNDDYFSLMACSFETMFPNYKTLSPASCYAIVFVTLFVITILLYVGILLIAKHIPQIAHWFIFIIDAIIIFFFIAIGYIPLAVVVILVLVLIALTYFRVKSGFTAGRG